MLANQGAFVQGQRGFAADSSVHRIMAKVQQLAKFLRQGLIFGDLLFDDLKQTGLGRVIHYRANEAGKNVFLPETTKTELPHSVLILHQGGRGLLTWAKSTSAAINLRFF